MRNVATKSCDGYWSIATFLLFAFAVLARIYFYYNHKDLWLDEAMLASAVYSTPLKDIFFQPLPHMQAAPLGFLLVSKSLGAVFGYSEYVLYFLPLVCGIGTLILSILIGRKILGYFGGFVLLLFCVGAQNLLYYTTEFKQYGVEAFCSFLLLYIYILARDKKDDSKAFLSFYIATIGCIIFANTAIFIAIAIGIGILYQNRNNIAIFLKHNLAWILSVGIFFVLYYFLYLKFQRVDGFYNYWADSFLPHTLSKYPQFIQETLLSILASFTPFKVKDYAWIYILFWLIGSYLFFRDRRDIFVVCISAMFLYIALSLFGIYPFGHNGVIGSRLSLYMAPIFYLPCCYVFVVFVKKTGLLKIFVYIILALLSYKTIMLYKEAYGGRRGHYIQQTHALITQAHKNYTENDVVLIYSATQPAYKYYSFLDSASYPYQTFSKDLSELETILKNTHAKKIYLIASHYPSNGWVEDLKSLSLKIDKNAVFTYGVGGVGSILIEIDKNR